MPGRIASGATASTTDSNRTGGMPSPRSMCRIASSGLSTYRYFFSRTWLPMRCSRKFLRAMWL